MQLEEAPDMPAAAKEKLSRLLLSDQQLAAYAAMKRFTDFNDLQCSSTLGEEGVLRQLTSAVDKVIAKSTRQHRNEAPTQEHVQRRSVRVG